MPKMWVLLFAGRNFSGTMGEEVSKIVLNCMTSFMHDPDYKSRGFFQLHFGSRALVRGGGDEVEDVHGAQR